MDFDAAERELAFVASKCFGRNESLSKRLDHLDQLGRQHDDQRTEQQFVCFSSADCSAATAISSPKINRQIDTVQRRFQFR